MRSLLYVVIQAERSTCFSIRIVLLFQRTEVAFTVILINVSSFAQNLITYLGFIWYEIMSIYNFCDMKQVFSKYSWKNCFEAMLQFMESPSAHAGTLVRTRIHQARP